MAWPFSGTWTGKTTADAGVIMAACCRAINERLAATGGSEISFFYNGGTKNYPTASDLAGMPLFALGSKSNLGESINAVRGMAASGNWYESDSYATAWTIASLSTDVGLGTISPLGLTDSLLNLTFWNQVKGACDRLLYYKNTYSKASYFEIQSTYTYQSGSELSAQDAWDLRRETSQLLSRYEVEWQIGSLGGVPLNYAALVRPVAEIEFAHSADLAGVIDKQELDVYTYAINEEWTGGTQFKQSIVVDIGNSDVNITVDPGDYEQHQWVDVTCFELGAASTAELEITSSEPSDDPWWVYSTHVDSLGSTLIKFGEYGVRLSIDVSGECTDQD